MKTLFLFILLPLLSSASTLLIPDSSVSYEKYTDKCRLEGYQCTAKFFTDKALLSASPQMDSFLDSIDFSNKEFVDGAQKKIQAILQTEMISATQLDMIQRLLEQMNSQNLGKPGKLIEEIKFIRQGLSPEALAVADGREAETVIYFKTVLSKTKFLKIKPSYLHLPYVLITYNQVPVHALMPVRNLAETFPLVTGTCETAKVNAELDVNSWNVMSEVSCGWTQSLTQNTSGMVSTVKENKGWLIIGALTIGALILANKYDVSFQF